MNTPVSSSPPKTTVIPQPADNDVKTAKTQAPQKAQKAEAKKEVDSKDTSGRTTGQPGADAAGERLLKPEEKKALHAQLKAASKDPDATVDILLTLDTPAARAEAVAALGPKGFKKAIEAADPLEQTFLAQEYGGGLKRAEREMMSEVLAAAGNVPATGALMGAVLNQTGYLPRDFMRNAIKSGMSYDDLFIEARGNDKLTEALARQYHSENIETGNAPYGPQLKDKADALVKHGIFEHSDIGFKDLRHLAATGTNTPEIESFISDALKSKNPEKLKLAKELMSMRETAMMNRFAEAEPTKMDVDTLQGWKDRFAKLEKRQDAIDTALGVKGDGKIPSIGERAVEFFMAVQKDDAAGAKAVFEAVEKERGPGGEQAFARLLAEPGSDMVDKLAFIDLLDHPIARAVFAEEGVNEARGNVGMWVEHAASLSGPDGDAYRTAFVNEAKRNPSFAADMRIAANDKRIKEAGRKFAAEVADQAGVPKVELSAAEAKVMADFEAAMLKSPPDIKAMNKAAAAAEKLDANGEARFADHAAKTLERSPDKYTLVQEIKPASMRYRTEAQMALSSQNYAEGKTKMLMSLDIPEKYLGVVAQQVGFNAKNDYDLAMHLTKEAVAHPDDWLGGIAKDALASQKLDGFIGLELSGQLRDHLKSQVPGFVGDVAYSGRVLLDDKAEAAFAQEIARGLADWPEDKRARAFAEIAEKSPAMAGRVRAAYVAEVYAKEGMDKALAAYSDQAAGLEGAEKKMFNKGIDELRSQPKFKSELKDSKDPVAKKLSPPVHKKPAIDRSGLTAEFADALRSSPPDAAAISAVLKKAKGDEQLAQAFGETLLKDVFKGKLDNAVEFVQGLEPKGMRDQIIGEMFFTKHWKGGAYAADAIWDNLYKLEKWGVGKEGYDRVVDAVLSDHSSFLLTFTGWNPKPSEAQEKVFEMALERRPLPRDFKRALQSEYGRHVVKWGSDEAVQKKIAGYLKKAGLNPDEAVKQYKADEARYARMSRNEKPASTDVADLPTYSRKDYYEMLKLEAMNFEIVSSTYSDMNKAGYMKTEADQTRFAKEAAAGLYARSKKPGGDPSWPEALRMAKALPNDPADFAAMKAKIISVIEAKISRS